MPPFQPSTPNSLKHKPLTHFSADRLIYASFCAPYICILEWVSYPTLYFTPNIHFLSSYLCDEAKIVFLFAYDQFDVRYKCEKTNYIKSLLSPQLRWGKLVMVKSMPFIAAPVMFLERSILA